MRAHEPLRNNLRATRTRLGLSQQELAARVGVTRQTIGALEAGLYTPSAALALRLARALGRSVEDLFWLEEDTQEVEAVPAADLPPGAGLRLALAQVGGRWVAHPLLGAGGFRTELIPVDGEGDWDGAAPTLRVRLLDEPDALRRSVVLAGCAPTLSLWARACERWHPGLRIPWIFANSEQALARLARGEVHAAGMHLYDPETDSFNVPFVRRALPGRAAVLVNLGVWEEGLLVRPGNPLGIAGVADLAREGVRIVNREPGAGSRRLLERLLRAARIPCEAVAGFDRVVVGHLEVARAVAEGRADAGVSTAAVAAAFGLGFVPLQQVRYDVALLKEYLDEPPVQQLLATLGHRRVRRQLEVLGGFDTSRTGDMAAVLEPAAPGDGSA